MRSRSVNQSTTYFDCWKGRTAVAYYNIYAYMKSANNIRKHWIWGLSDEISRFSGHEYECGSVLGFCVVQCGRYWPTFQRVEALSSSETSVKTYQTAQRKILEDSHLRCFLYAEIILLVYFMGFWPKVASFLSFETRQCAGWRHNSYAIIVTALGTLIV
jgi:hypothetical protein